MERLSKLDIESTANPCIIFLKPDTWARCCTVLAAIILQKIKKSIVAFPRKCQKPNFLTVNPLIIPGFIFWNLTPWSDVADCWPLQKIKTIYSSIFEKCKKIEFFTLNPLLIPRLFSWNLKPRPDIAQCWPLSSCKKSKTIIV